MQDYAQNHVHTMCSHRLPYGPECPPSLNAPPRTPIPWRGHHVCPMRVARHGGFAHAQTVARHVGVVPPARVVVRRSTPSAQLGDSGTSRSSGRGSLAVGDGHVAAPVHTFTKRSNHLFLLRVSGRPGVVPAWGRLTLSLTEEQIAQVEMP
jgi:hypothetical protein